MDEITTQEYKQALVRLFETEDKLMADLELCPDDQSLNEEMFHLENDIFRILKVLRNRYARPTGKSWEETHG